jgi:hypothetical protein
VVEIIISEGDVGTCRAKTVFKERGRRGGERERAKERGRYRSGEERILYWENG